MGDSTVVDGPVAHCVGDLIEFLRERIAKHKKILWFRGHRSADWEVAPGIWRDKYTPDQERDLTNRFSTRAATRHQTLPAYDDLATWLSLMQHYGLPTRLLDWSRSPLVAAYFAIEAYIYEKVAEPQDAVIWTLEPHCLNESEGLKKFTPSIESRTCREMLEPAFTDKATENGKVLAVMAAEKDLRMFVQQGCFTVHSDRTPLNKRLPAPKYLSGITIPANDIRLFAAEIEVCGFCKGDIFPDLGNLAAELKAKRPRG